MVLQSSQGRHDEKELKGRTV